MPEIILPNNWTPREDQLPVWRYLEAGGKHAEVVAHRRWGKDDVCLHRAGIAAFERPAGYWHMLPEYSQARKAIWDAINPRTGKKRIDEAFPVELRKTTRNQEMMIEFVNGSTWQVVGSDSFNSLVGTTPAGITYSEWALANPAARAYLRPIIAENNGWQVFITTSRGRNHAYKTLKAAQDDPKAFAQVIDATQSPVFTAEQLAAEKASYIAEFGLEYGTAMFEQEYMCSFDAANMGAILAPAIGRAEKAGRIGKHVEYDPDGSGIHVSVDIGRRDTAVFWFWQPCIGGYSILKCISGWGIDAEEWCQKVNEALGDWKLDRIWLPHDARAKTFAAKHSAVEIFLEKFGVGKVEIVPRSSISDRVNAGRQLIERCQFSNECDDGLEALRAWHYKWNDDNKTMSRDPEHDWSSHFGDAFTEGCKVMQLHKPVSVPDKTPFYEVQPTLNDLWSETPEKSKWI